MLHQLRFLGCLAAASLLLNGCAKDTTATTETAMIPGIILENMDTTVNPREDFYGFVNGNWVKNTEIPEDRTSWGGFGVLRKATDADVLAIIADAQTSGKYAADTDQAKAIALYEAYLDTTKRNALGLEPLKQDLAQLDDVKTVADLQLIMQNLETSISIPLLGLSGFPDLNNSSVNAAYVGAGGFGLPDRDFYLDEDTKSQEIRAEYVKHVSRMLQMLGDEASVADASARRILDLEKQLAEPQLDKLQQRNPNNYNNPRSIAEFQEMLPALDVEALMAAFDLEDVDTVMVTELKYTAALNEFLQNTSIEDIKTLVRWSTINANTSRLTTEIDEANFEFYSKYLNGAKQQRPMDERALGLVSGSVGEALGQLYVDAKFPPEAKAKAELMIANIITAFQNRIEALDWMTEPTKQKAIEKLDKFTVKIAYPDEWEDYSNMLVSADKSYFENRKAVDKWNTEKNLSEIGQPVDKSEWGMAPQTVNAYFNPLNNEIVFPAAILQPPFYNYTADEAVNYGGIGAVIGHEISHAFDDQGSRFDGDGNLINWWQDEDLENFTARGKALADQYSAIEVMDSVTINGEFTLGENIGDLGGVLGAYDGLQLFYAENGRPENIDGYTPEQRFFMSWTTVWRTLQRDEALRNQVKTDPHSPGKVRATQPLVNIDAFYEAFDIQEGDGMWLAPEERVRIW
ncbi:M13 family metallopeptidase [Neolewinella antarctica]|uniref:Endopeptidase n=1 Tax=Neolewinella antarctica TaxID=442734 RepID=A0ABX0X5Q0_9BACT|nr:M13 family metallopeptidase [Neolewinella antarctica]NJC24533.1 putative endopeptidase [Neolewinella antarctica]